MRCMRASSARLRVAKPEKRIFSERYSAGLYHSQSPAATAATAAATATATIITAATAAAAAAEAALASHYVLEARVLKEGHLVTATATATITVAAAAVNSADPQARALALLPRAAWVSTPAKAKAMMRSLVIEAPAPAKG